MDSPSQARRLGLGEPREVPPLENRELYEEGLLQRIWCHCAGGCGVDSRSESVGVTEPIMGTPLPPLQHQLGSYQIATHPSA